MRRHHSSPGNDPHRTGYPNDDTSAPACESADHRRDRADLPAAPSHHVEPPPQACVESAEHQGPGQGAGAAQSTVARRMLVWATASRPRLDYAGQGEQDSRQNQTQAHGDSLGNLVRLEFRPLCRDPHGARCTPVPGSRRVLLDLGLKGAHGRRPTPIRARLLSSRTQLGPLNSAAATRWS